MSEELLKLLQATFGDDDSVQIFGMDENGDITPLNRGALANTEVQFQVWNLIDLETQEQVGVGDEVFDPVGDSYRLTKGEPPEEGKSQLGHIWLEDKHGLEFCVCPSAMNLKFVYKRTIKR